MKTFLEIICLFILAMVCVCFWRFMMPPSARGVQPGKVASRFISELDGTPKVPSTPAKQVTAPNDGTNFYQVIIDNNLFRPLNWTPPKQQSDYTLIGTAVTTNPEDTKAIIFERRSNRLYTVKVGDTLGDASVKEIQSKQVTLQASGKNIVLQGRGMLFF